MTPPERLRHALTRLRMLGYDFERARPIALAFAIRGANDDSAMFWAETWIGEQRAVWASEYARPAGARPALSPIDDDHSTSAQLASQALVVA